MSQAAHTEGPWSLDCSKTVAYIQAGPRDIGFVLSTDPQTRDTLPMLANAQLMAAAPNLKKATKALCHLVRSMAAGPGWTQELLDDILAFGDAALAESEGEAV